MRAAHAFAPLSVLVSLATYTYAANCNCKCPFNYAPVCAADSKGIEETYPNECSFECYKCTHNKNLVIRSRGECVNKSPDRNPGRSEKQKTAAGNTNFQSTSSTKCNCQCPFNYAPICAVDSRGIEETYPNQCSFECYKCTHGKDFRVHRQGECSDKSAGRPPRPTSNSGTAQKPNAKCNCNCTFNYAPVCAGDTKGIQETYPNTCSFECYKCTHGKDLRILKQGECSEKVTNRPPQPTDNNGRQKNQPGKCNCQCPLNYAPVCALNSRGVEETYPNSCSFECYKCTHGLDHVIRKQGACSDNSSNQRTRNNLRPTINNKKCNCNCGQDYSPLCAVNSKGAEQTFPNRCSLDCHNCTHNEDYVLRRRGECQSRASQLPPRSKTRTA